MQENRTLHNIVRGLDILTDDPADRFVELSIVPYALWRCCLDGYRNRGPMYTSCDEVGEDECVLLFVDLADMFCQYGKDEEGGDAR